MSTIACITAHQCDGCDRIVVLKSDAEYREFERSWYDGFRVDFCHDCRKPNAGRILEDQALRRQIADRVARINAEPKEEYAH